MQPDQDREFELVLGNKQLFSLLFLVFVLLGVFFAMGYVMGRNSAPGDLAQQTPPAKTDDAVPQDGRPSASTGSGQAALPPTIPASEATARPPEPAPATEPTPPPGRDEPTTARLIDPKPGQVYLQVIAVARTEAEMFVEVLVRKGFRAAMAPGPTDKIMRVLVGPLANDSEVAKVRTELEQANFKPMIRRY
jgi:cell division septation protein DedD